ncbi:MAG: hypothetical protein JNM27_14350 [Leptospirales bacterium]|nr:hypothetical protein [Leptospirales bacterium]
MRKKRAIKTGILCFLLTAAASSLQAQEKILGPYNWLLLPARGNCGGETIAQDQISENMPGLSEPTIARSGKTPLIAGRAWKQASLETAGDLNELLKRLNVGNADNARTAVYALIELKTEREQRSLMRTGSDDSIRVYLNGEIVHENPAMRGASDYQEEFPVVLKPGTNNLLIKVVNCGGGFSLFAGIQAFFQIGTRKYEPLPDAPGLVFENASAARKFRDAREAAKADLPRAILLFEQAEREAPLMGVYSFGYGYDLLHKGSPEKAVPVLKRALEKRFRPALTRAHIALALSRLRDPLAVSAWGDCLSEANALLAQAKPGTDDEKDGIAIRFFCMREKTRLLSELLDLAEARLALQTLEKVRPASDDSNLTGPVLRTGIGYVWLDEMIGPGFAKTAANVYLWQGHSQLAAGQFDQAAASYAQARDSAAGADAGMQVNFAAYIDIASRCKTYAGVKPDRILKIASITIPRVQGTFPFPGGEKRTADNTVTARMRALISLNESLLQRFLVAHSKGLLSAEFDRVELSSTLRGLQWSGDPSDVSRTPLLESLDPHAGAEIMRQAKQHDTLIFYWNGETLSTSANGGSTMYPYYPYYIYSPIRGYLQIPANWLSENSLPLMVHEFFHMRDGMVESSRQAGHCETDRGRFPAFKGPCGDGFSYYVFHMQSTPDAQWRNHQYQEKFPHGNLEGILAKTEKTLKIPMSELMQARKLTEEATAAVQKKDVQTAERLYRKVLEIVPGHQEALAGLARLAAEREDSEGALRLHRERLKHYDDSYGNFSAGWLLHRKLNRVDESLAHYERARELRTDVYHFLEASLHAGIVVRDTKGAAQGIAVLQQCEADALAAGDSTFAGRCVLEIGVAHGEILKDQNEALRQVKRAIELGYNTDHSRWYLDRYTGKTTRSVVPAIQQQAPEHKAAISSE